MMLDYPNESHAIFNALTITPSGLTTRPNRIADRLTPQPIIFTAVFIQHDISPWG